LGWTSAFVSQVTNAHTPFRLEGEIGG
jgi:hypothetical protein